MIVSYDDSFSPPAPVVEIAVIHPDSRGTERIRFMLDSGAYMTVVPDSTVTRLGLERVGVAGVTGFGSATRAWIYSTLLQVPTRTTPQLCQVLSWGRAYGLVGRDLLNRWHVVLDGPRLQLTVEEANT